MLSSNARTRVSSVVKSNRWQYLSPARCLPWPVWGSHFGPQHSAVRIWSSVGRFMHLCLTPLERSALVRGCSIGSNPAQNSPTFGLNAWKRKSKIEKRKLGICSMGAVARSPRRVTCPEGPRDRLRRAATGLPRQPDDVGSPGQNRHPAATRRLPLMTQLGHREVGSLHSKFDALGPSVC
jgi:hypothetical protein